MSPTFAQNDLLPDLLFDQATLAGNEIDNTTLPGQLLFRFDTSIPNIGSGAFQLESTGVDSGDGRENVVQRIFRDDMTSYTVDAGDFLYDPTSRAMESPGWVAYRLRTILPGDGVGPILWAGGKSSVHISSSALYNASLPNVPDFDDRIIASRDVHGISVGWTDLYPRLFPFQWLNVTGFLSGRYWLEVEVDPANNILEQDETNNVARIMIDLDLPDGDGDGLSDTFEITIGTDPLDADSDGDGLTDFDEVAYDGDVTTYHPYPAGLDLDARNSDTDGDGVSDRTELNLGTDPLDPDDGNPTRFTSTPFIFFLLFLLFLFGILGLSF